MIKFLFLSILAIIISEPAVRGQSRLELQKSREGSEEEKFYQGNVFKVDSSWHISLRPVEVISPYVFKDKRTVKKYEQLLIDVRKAYPLSQIVQHELKLVQSELDSIYKDRKSQKKYIRWYQDYVYKTYIDSLRTLNVRQGKILLKLIGRETGKSPYELIKEYRGSMNAVFWQSLAFLFGANLRTNYDPLEDDMIENIVLRIKAGEFN